MEIVARIESCLEDAIDRATAEQCPPLLAQAVRHAVFPGGARVRPQLCLSVAAACSATDEQIPDAVACAIEMMHCASLVHDDLPCFDDADLRRGKETVHTRFGEPIAVLVGDALIVEAFNTVSLACAHKPERIAPLLSCISRSVGMSGGIIAGQAWESERDVDVHEYHRAKTGSLFVGAVVSGAIATGANPEPWRPLGQKIGEAYQLADDLLDAAGTQAECGKPVAQDSSHDRPSAVARLGIEGTMKLLRQTVGEAVACIPDCEGAEDLRDLIAAQATRLVPAKLAKAAA
ncbi:polyprenyl synthetase family protein [Pseudahrensia aquimaris]|uniref:Polyprenyl synthetase family protein n=1 Tax=Pseudahrensia aquimaris TaxID=744461 RepID=A0ABW3FNT0_9HYPH